MIWFEGGGHAKSEEEDDQMSLRHLVGAMVEARHAAGLTQQEIAERMGTND